MIAVVASTVQQFDLVCRELRLPRREARFVLAAVNLSGLRAGEVVVAEPCRARGVPGVTRYWEAVREVERMETRDGTQARRIYT